MVCPGGMPTAQATEFEAPENADWDLIMRIASPRGFMETADVAKAIAFLASDDAAADPRRGVPRRQRQGRGLSADRHPRRRRSPARRPLRVRRARPAATIAR